MFHMKRWIFYFLVSFFITRKGAVPYKCERGIDLHLAAAADLDADLGAEASASVVVPVSASASGSGAGAVAGTYI